MHFEDFVAGKSVLTPAREITSGDLDAFIEVMNQDELAVFSTIGKYFMQTRPYTTGGVRRVEPDASF
jgi:hypothetical protein